MTPDLRKSLYCIDKIKRQLGIELLYCEDDIKMKDAAIRLGVMDALQCLSEPQGVKWVIKQEFGCTWIVSRFWGYPKAQDNGYTGQWYVNKPFRDHPEGARLEALYVGSMLDLCHPGWREGSRSLQWSFSPGN